MGDGLVHNCMFVTKNTVTINDALVFGFKNVNDVCCVVSVCMYPWNPKWNLPLLLTYCIILSMQLCKENINIKYKVNENVRNVRKNI